MYGTEEEVIAFTLRYLNLIISEHERVYMSHDIHDYSSVFTYFRRDLINKIVPIIEEFKANFLSRNIPMSLIKDLVNPRNPLHKFTWKSNIEGIIYSYDKTDTYPTGDSLVYDFTLFVPEERNDMALLAIFDNVDY